MMDRIWAFARPFTLAKAQGLPRAGRRTARALVLSTVCSLALVGCMSSGPRSSSGNGGGGDGINDAALGVAASPRVTDQQTNLPRGGGRAQVGRPYRIAGRLYTPREDPDYDRTGVASWYGDAFHGRLTANGEVYDMHTLSAAHPTLPLPSYVRVTNLENNHSVVVRVNDRGPFSYDRVIDLSKRAADVLDFRHDGVARVRVQYAGAAPLHGQDVEWLEATAQVNGVPIGGGDPNVMFARAPVPVPTPAPSSQIALVSTSGATTATTQRFDGAAVQQPSFLGTLFGSQNATNTPVQPVQTFAPQPATSAPLELTPPSAVPATSTTAYWPTNGTPAVAPMRAPGGLIPNAPIPSEPVGFMASGFMASDLETGFTQRNQSSVAQNARIQSAHHRAEWSALDAASQIALQSQTLSRLSAVAGLASPALQALPSTLATGSSSLVQIGIFGDPANVERVRGDLASFGDVLTEQINSGGRALTQVRLRAAVSTPQQQSDLLRRLALQGYTDAYVTDGGNSS